MRVEVPEFAHSAETLLAVGLGAVLATVGGFVATLLEARLHKRERERTAALTFGEIVANLGALIRAAQSSHGIGEPWGQLTIRMFRAARHEIDAYERSRAALSDLSDASLRLGLQALMLRTGLALDGIVEGQSDEVRAGSYEFLLELAPGIDDLVRRLIPVGGQSLALYETLPHSPHGYLRPSSSWERPGGEPRVT